MEPSEPAAGRHPVPQRRLRFLLGPEPPAGAALPSRRELMDWILDDPVLQIRLHARVQAQAALATAQAATGAHSPQASIAEEALVAATEACRRATFAGLLRRGHSLESLKEAFGDLVPGEP